MKLRVTTLTLLCFTLFVIPATAQSYIYDNGPINGTVDAWTINFGYAVTDSFIMPTAQTITGFQFGVWAYPGDTPLSVDFSIGTSPFSGTPETVALTSTYLYTNQYGYDIDLETAYVNIPLSAGTYWLTLQNAVTTQGNPLYWDENSGPSLAQESSLGTIPSESFQILGPCDLGGHNQSCGPTPEPGTIALFGSGVLGLAALLRRKIRL